MEKVVEYRENPMITARYFCGKCNEEIENFKYEIVSIKRYKYCPYCGEKIDWEK